MKFIKRRRKSTVEAYACNCQGTCYSCSSVCNQATCKCAEDFGNPFVDNTFELTGDSTTQMSEEELKPAEWMRYK